MDSFKCENGGIRIYSKENGLSCWCTPDYVGEHCLHQSAVERLENVFPSENNGGYGPRILSPACPLECCANDKTLPPVKTLYNKILKPKPGQFIPDRKNRNLLLDAFYQYFVMQFSDPNSNLTVTASQLYGSGAASERSRRSLSGGKLKTRKFDYKHFATNHAFAPYSDVYLKALTKGISNDRSLFSRMFGQQFKREEMLSSSTMLYVLSILWAREHNRVCDELSRKWPCWTHEQLYKKARKIVTGQMMNIMMNEILNVELRPEVSHHRMENIHSSGNPIEVYLTMAVSNMPEKLQYSSTNLKFYNNTSEDSEADLKDSLQLMMSSKMSIVTAHDDGPLTGKFTKALMKLSREQCLQSFNNYRRRLGLRAYNSFFDLTGNIETATELEKLYSTVEKVEFLTGVLTEKSSSGVLPTAKVLSNSFIVNAILGNRLITKHLWAPDTFGGVEFFNLVKSTSLETLICRNVDNCDQLKDHRSVK
ncbi:unnamed protein product [Macrosiphum euphorbiae]|uniref:prostaglandin-endoperoxide synthase n=1 Tax=Macrosiphum euphorbiae TaxID=13131 RepID=A0AAV0X4C2_9HEMI|nr:unnamed protein product [Macrosiphum euphorbiae]